VCVCVCVCVWCVCMCVWCVCVVCVYVCVWCVWCVCVVCVCGVCVCVVCVVCVCGVCGVCVCVCLSSQQSSDAVLNGAYISVDFVRRKNSDGKCTHKFENLVTVLLWLCSVSFGGYKEI